MLYSFNRGLLCFVMCTAILFISTASNPADSINDPTKKNNKIVPGKLWLDSDGNHINAHGGGILFYNDTYYWFGEHKSEGRGGNSALFGVRCYSSGDLYNWENKGLVLKVEADPNSEITKGCVIERPKVIYNENTGKFVMWFHLELKGKGYSAARTALAVSDNILGPYKYVKSLRPNAGQWPLGMPDEYKTKKFSSKLEWWTPEWNKAVEHGLFVQRDFQGGQMSRDMTLFVDDDGTAYHIHSSEENLTLHISELNKDYTGFTGRWIRVMPGGHNEAPALFKYKGKYFMIASGCTGWEPNAARMFTADSVLGEWKPLGNPCVGDNANLTFHSQSTFVLPVEDETGSFVFMADRWRPKNPIDGRYIWLPVQFENEKPVIKWFDSWNFPISEQ